MRKIRSTVDQLLCLPDQLLGFVALNAVAAEGRPTEQRLDLARESVTLPRQVADGRQVGIVGRVVSNNRAIGEVQAVQTKRSERRIQLLVDRCELGELAVAAQRLWPSLFVQILDQDTAVMNVVILQSGQSQHCWTQVSVIGEHLVVEIGRAHV